MKRTSIIFLFSLVVSSSAFSQDYFDDLSTVELNLEANTTEAIQINYPGYRIGGGTPNHKEITDCLIVDIKNSDQDVTLAQKQSFAKRLVVEDGARFGNEDLPKLVPTVKGENVVFRLVSKSTYMTHILVKSKDGKSLQSNIDAVIRTPAVPVGLVYVRGCRF